MGIPDPFKVKKLKKGQKEFEVNWKKLIHLILGMIIGISLIGGFVLAIR